MDQSSALEGTALEWTDRLVIGTVYELRYGGFSAVAYARDTGEDLLGVLVYLGSGRFGIRDVDSDSLLAEICEVYSVTIAEGRVFIDGWTGERPEIRETRWILSA